MSTAHQGTPVGEADALASLLRLARKGAYAVPTGTAASGDGVYAVFSPRNDFARAIATIGGAAVAYGLAQGWLEAAEGGRVQLTSSGIKVLRRARSGQGAPEPRRQGAKRAEATIPRPPAAAPARQEGPLAWLRRRKDKDGRPLISEAQFNAGERLRADYWRGQLMPRVTASWSDNAAAGKRVRRSGPGVGVELGDGVVAARERVSRAMRAVGPELADVLIDVCCHEMGLQDAGRENAWPARTTKIVLGLALDRLARHYGLIAPDPPRGPSRVRHWGEEGYRPTLDAWQG